MHDSDIILPAILICFAQSLPDVICQEIFQSFLVSAIVMLDWNLQVQNVQILRRSESAQQAGLPDFHVVLKVLLIVNPKLYVLNYPIVIHPILSYPIGVCMMILLTSSTKSLWNLWFGAKLSSYSQSPPLALLRKFPKNSAF